MAPKTRRYEQRRAETAVLYGIVQEHLEGFLLHVRESGERRLPHYVEQEFRRYVECGIAIELGGFNLHAGVSLGAGCTEARERLLCYCARSLLSLERLRDGRISYRVQHGDAVRIMTPMQFMAISKKTRRPNPASPDRAWRSVFVGWLLAGGPRSDA